MCENICIYCLKDSSTTQSQEHVFPEALGSKETLPKGYVCDNCNNYFSKMDKDVLYNRIIALQLGTEGIPGKKGNPRPNIGQNLCFPNPGSRQFKLTLGPVSITKETLEADFRPTQDVEFNELRFARGIRKIVFNCYALKFGQKKALQSRFNNLRRYIKTAKPNELWPYAARDAQNNNKVVTFDFFETYDEILKLRILTLDFVVSLMEWKTEIEFTLKEAGFIIVKRKGQWGASNLLGLQE